MRPAALALLIFCLLAPAARADGLETLQVLAGFHLHPAPLVPTTAPRPLDDLGATLSSAGRSRRGYSWRLVHYTPSGPDAVIALSRGEWPTARAAFRELGKDGYTRRGTRVRGRPAFLLTRRGRETIVLWNEDGSVYTLATGTPRKVSVAGLRATAAGLDHLGANYSGDSFQPGSSNTYLDAVLVTTDRYVSGVVEWGTDNCTFNGLPAAAHGGTASFVMVPLQARAFTIALSGPLVSPAGWSGELTGAVSPAAIGVSLHGSGTFDGGPCDTGVLSVSAPARDPD